MIKVKDGGSTVKRRSSAAKALEAPQYRHKIVPDKRQKILNKIEEQLGSQDT